MQPFCFCSNGEANEGYEKGNEINLCKKGKPTPGKGKQTLAKGKNTSAKGKPASAKGKPLKKGAVQKGILKKHNLQKLGQLSLQDKIKQIAETNDDEHEAAKELQKSMTTAEKKTGLGPNTRPTPTRMAMRKKGMHSTMHLKMKRES